MNKRFHDLDLWVYRPGCKAPQSGGGGFRRPVNVHVVYGSIWLFNNIRSQVVAHHTVAENVDSRYGGDNAAFGKAMNEAYKIAYDFNLFLELIIGTSDKRTKKYKQFMEEVDRFKAYIMRRKLENS